MRQARHSFLAAAVIVGAIGSVSAFAKWTSRRDPVGTLVYEIAHQLTPGKGRPVQAKKPAMKASKPSSAGSKKPLARPQPARRPSGSGGLIAGRSEARVITNERAQQTQAARREARFTDRPRFIGPDEPVRLTVPRVSVPPLGPNAPAGARPIPSTPARPALRRASISA